MAPPFLEAPFGAGTAAFMHVTGLATLRAWDSPVFEKSVQTFREIALERLRVLGGARPHHGRLCPLGPVVPLNQVCAYLLATHRLHE